MTNNKPFFITNQYGKGRVFSCIAHPEATPGMMWMIRVWYVGRLIDRLGIRRKCGKSERF